MAHTLVDSHCHIDFPEFSQRIDEVLLGMAQAGVSHALCVSVNMEDFPQVLGLAVRYPNLFASVGVHPDHEDGIEPDAAMLVAASDHPRIVAIGETGLDYYRRPERKQIQQARFAAHIHAARHVGKPLIVHTRSAAADTLALMKSEGAREALGVMHCFTETWAVAQEALDMGFYISFSGLVTFRNAADLRDVARRVPFDRLLVETDSPYLAPVPHRGKTNEPAFVANVANCVAEARGVPLDDVAQQTTENFFRLFDSAREHA
jgi:TatD DNase family protein